VNRGAHDYLPKGHVEGDLVARSIRYAIARNHGETVLRSATKQLELAHDRERIAQDLHDTVVQQLFATGMGLQSLSGYLDEPHRSSLMLEVLVEAQSSVLGFHPSFTKRNVHDLPDNLLHEARAVVQEALANVAKHAGASALDVFVFVEDDQFIVEVTDNGRGVAAAPSAGEGDPLSGNGLANLARRAEGLGGSFHLGPGPGGGTKLRWQVPFSFLDR